MCCQLFQKETWMQLHGGASIWIAILCGGFMGDICCWIVNFAVGLGMDPSSPAKKVDYSDWP